MAAQELSDLQILLLANSEKHFNTVFLVRHLILLKAVFCSHFQRFIYSIREPSAALPISCNFYSLIEVAVTWLLLEAVGTVCGLYQHHDLEGTTFLAQWKESTCSRCRKSCFHVLTALGYRTAALWHCAAGCDLERSLPRHLQTVWEIQFTKGLEMKDVYSCALFLLLCFFLAV